MNHNMSILIAEDDPTDIRLLELALRKAGVKNPIQVVRSGNEAIEYLQGSEQFADRSKHPFPCILFTDLRMPRMDGFGVLRWLREHPACSVIPVIVMANSTMDADVKRAYQLGANSYMAKPTMFNKLVQMMRAAYEYWAWCEKPVVPGSC